MSFFRQCCVDNEQVPIQDILQVPEIRDPEMLWEQLIAAGYISNRQPIDLETFMAFPEGTKRCAKEQSGAFCMLLVLIIPHGW